MLRFVFQLWITNFFFTSFLLLVRCYEFCLQNGGIDSWLSIITDLSTDDWIGGTASSTIVMVVALDLYALIFLLLLVGLCVDVAYVTRKKTCHRLLKALLLISLWTSMLFLLEWSLVSLLKVLWGELLLTWERFLILLLFAKWYKPILMFVSISVITSFFDGFNGHHSIVKFFFFPTKYLLQVL